MSDSAHQPWETRVEEIRHFGELVLRRFVWEESIWACEGQQTCTVHDSSYGLRLKSSSRSEHVEMGKAQRLCCMIKISPDSHFDTSCLGVAFGWSSSPPESHPINVKKYENVTKFI